MGALGGGNLARKGLAIRPNRAIFEMLLFPDRHGALQSIDRVSARVERGGAVRGTHRDPNAGFANLKPPQAMHDNDAVNLKFLSHLRADFAHFCERH